MHTNQLHFYPMHVELKTNISPQFHTAQIHETCVPGKHGTFYNDQIWRVMVHNSMVPITTKIFFIFALETGEQTQFVVQLLPAGFFPILKCRSKVLWWITQVGTFNGMACLGFL